MRLGVGSGASLLGGDGEVAEEEVRGDEEHSQAPRVGQAWRAVKWARCEVNPALAFMKR